jgi:hypothetical protein
MKGKCYEKRSTSVNETENVCSPHHWHKAEETVLLRARGRRAVALQVSVLERWKGVSETPLSVGVAGYRIRSKRDRITHLMLLT